VDAGGGGELREGLEASSRWDGEGDRSRYNGGEGAVALGLGVVGGRRAAWTSFNGVKRRGDGGIGAV